MSKTYR